ncbi:lipolysis-stimulated lipoprotein receptor-like isoform X2 [Chiroxiphia lanceolata]|uniref:lipolysis-stimulated lipoprotein receptor-like isoform X2 n=1 Tax=Chiroxiphia lanceolata TaxID=296741 RepID=UPI0013CF00DB|nr:lipolysis-stimulated lipoprotein receptor-like isoform X2 [Chiroxiphia lanceolata]
MAAALGALLALLAPCVTPLQVTVPDPRTVALLFQPVLIRCQFQVTSGPPPIVTWKYKSFCPSSTSGDTWGGPESAAGGDTAGTCPDSARTVRIVATKQGDTVTLGDFYRGRAVTIRGGAELSLGPAAWGDSGFYICTVTSTQDLQGNNEAVAELVVLDWLFVALVALGGVLVALGVGLCWCQCCPHTCCCYVRCPCCPQTCCCPEALYLAGKAATSGGTFSPAPPALALQLLGSSQSSQVPLLRDSDGSVVSGPSVPPPTVLRYLEENLATWNPPGRPPHWRAGPPSGPAPSDISSLHEAPWTPPRRSWTPPRSPSTPPRRPRTPPRGPPSPPRGRWRSAEVLGGSEWEEESLPPARPPPRSRSRDDLLGGARDPPQNPPGPPRRLRKNDALSRESLVV